MKKKVLLLKICFITIERVYFHALITLRRYVKKCNSALTPYCYRRLCILPFSGKRYNMYTECAVPNFLTYSDSSKKQQQIRTSERVYIIIHILSVYASKTYQLLLINDGHIANHHCWPPCETADLTKYVC